MKVLNLLTSGEAGGIESLCRDIGVNAEYENAFCFLFQGGAIYEQMRGIGLKTYNLSHIGGKISWKKYKEIKKIAKDYDIIVAHNGEPVLKLYHILLSYTLKKKFVTVIHSCYDKAFEPSNFIKRKINRLIFQKDLNRSNLIIAVSNAGKESYKNFFKFPEEKLKIVYNGIDNKKLAVGRAAPVNREKPYNLLYVGRLIEAKGVDLLIRACAYLKQDYPITVSIVGDGPYRAELESLAKQLQIEDIIAFYGRQVEVIPFYQNSSIFVYPSVWQEVFGISIVEGMAFGRPCVANYIGGIPEIIQDGISGYLTKEISAKGLEQILRDVIIDIESGKVNFISKKAKERAEYFSITNTVKKLKFYFESL